MDSATTSGLTVPLFLLGAAITLAVCAITIAGWKHKFLVWGLLGVAVLLALAGIFWKPFSEAVPAVSDVITDLASSQTIWFLAIVAASFSTIASTRKLQRVASPNPSSPPYDDTKLNERFSAELDGLKESLQAQFATVRSNHEALQERVAKDEAGLREKHDKLRSSLFAVYARERLRELAVEIKQDADDLYLRLKSGERYDVAAWQQWENVVAP